MANEEINLRSDNEAKLLCGPHDGNLRLIEDEFEVSIYARGHNLTVEGAKENIEDVLRLIQELLITIRKGVHIRKHEILYAVKSIKGHITKDVHSIYLDKIDVSAKRQFVTPKSKGQKCFS